MYLKIEKRENDNLFCQTLKNILYYNYMQYQVGPTDQTPENAQKPFLLCFWFIQKMDFCDFLNDPA